MLGNGKLHTYVTEREGKGSDRCGGVGGTATRCVAEMDVSKWPFCRHKKSWPVRSGSTSHHVEGPLKRQHESRILRTAAVKLKTATEERRGEEEGAKFQLRGRKKICKNFLFI